ncbi:hypothetical protein L6164_023551 [Bauhinia variegata]|uniref:Uncharacterized protein n=1 Tax=Bauhinia variegata TaxID=167791 RepID=A0ACB9MIJ6_BAUVA|nr:hypothetical protein L6164_023551 [Bauhinia variegata]
MGFLRFLALSLLSRFLFTQFIFTVTDCFPHVQLAEANCHEDESAALLEFKASFGISKSASLNPLSYPKIDSWMENTDFCSWHGVKCDERTGYVIGLDLSSSQLQGLLNPNSSVFYLVKLQSLNLSDNNLSYSQIPSTLGDLSSLKYLNLSQSKFSGEIPAEISKLSKLRFLDLSLNDVSSFPFNRLQLKTDNLRCMIQNLTNLETLMLAGVKISSPVPDIFTNLTSLENLNLFDCDLFGEFPIRIFHLPKLRNLDLRSNQNLVGYLDEFHSSSLLESLRLDGTSFQGTLSASIGNLNSLKGISLNNCNFSGSIPSSLGNLTQLIHLGLCYNKFRGYIPSSLSNLSQLYDLCIGGNEINGLTVSWIGKLTRLQRLNLDSINIDGEIPFPFANLSEISILSLGNCNLSGEIPHWIMNLTNLVVLNLLDNKLHGQIPPTLFELENLSSLGLCGNFLGGDLDLSKLLKLKRLSVLCLLGINLSMHTERSSFNVTLPKFVSLELISCNLKEFPPFLQEQDNLEVLQLSNNSISGSLPSWLWTMKNLWVLDVSENLLIGEISPFLCNLKSLEFLVMSFNNLGGSIPPCLGSFSYSLKVLMLQKNKFSGLIPRAYQTNCALRAIDLSQNNLQGQLPKALVNCRMLEFFDVSNNQINDSFPSWLGSSLPQLKVLSLRSNKFFGTIGNMKNCTFPKLHIIDLSHNNFSGNFPFEVTWRWKSMRDSNNEQLMYEQTYHYYKATGSYGPATFLYSFTMFNKGNMMVYNRLQQIYYFIAIDISSNKFDGEIPHAIGDLKGLVLLNLSNNMFTGVIPSSLGKLSQLEALDLSHNSLSGRIPQQLAQLTFLEVFDVSNNYLLGPIPQTKQFATFESSSYEGNQGLCGSPLLKKCVSSVAPSSSADEDQETKSPFDFGWKVVLVGYGCGLVVGVVIGSTLSLERHGWLRRIYRF